MSTDREQRHREAIAGILGGSATLAAECGRPDGLVVERLTVGAVTETPVLCYDLQTFDDAGGQATLLVTGVGRGPDAAAQARRLLEIAAAELTYDAFQAQGLEVCPLDGVRRSVDEIQDVTQRFALEGSPDLVQADWAVTLLVFS